MQQYGKSVSFKIKSAIIDSAPEQNRIVPLTFVFGKLNSLLGKGCQGIKQ
jgi:hypothetical protein